MIPGPAPVIDHPPGVGQAAARSRAWAYSGSSGRVRAEPKIVTLGTSWYGAKAPEGVAHLGERGAGDLQVEPVGAVEAEADAGARGSRGPGRRSRRGRSADELGERLVHVVVEGEGRARGRDGVVDVGLEVGLGEGLAIGRSGGSRPSGARIGRRLG